MRIFESVRVGRFSFGMSQRVRIPRRYWTHPGCAVHHEREDTANACAKRMARR